MYQTSSHNDGTNEYWYGRRVSVKDVETIDTTEISHDTCTLMGPSRVKGHTEVRTGSHRSSQIVNV